MNRSINLQSWCICVSIVICLAVGCSSDSRTPSNFGKILLGLDKSEPTARVHFIAKGRDVYLDKNQNAIAEESERLAPDAITHLKPASSNHGFEITAKTGIDPQLVSESLPQRLNILVRVGCKPPYQMSGTMLMTEQPNDNNWLHFGGPLAFISPTDLTIRNSSSTPEELKLFLGTIATGSISNDDRTQPTNNTIPQLNRTAIVVPQQQPPYPQAVVEFECKDNDPIVNTFVMDYFC